MSEEMIEQLHAVQHGLGKLNYLLSYWNGRSCKWLLNINVPLLTFLKLVSFGTFLSFLKIITCVNTESQGTAIDKIEDEMDYLALSGTQGKQSIWITNVLIIKVEI